MVFVRVLEPSSCEKTPDEPRYSYSFLCSFLCVCVCVCVSVSVCVSACVASPRSMRDLNSPTRD